MIKRIEDEFNIHIPEKMNALASLNLSNFLAKNPLARNYRFDFIKMKMIFPFAALLTSRSIIQFIDRINSILSIIGVRPKYHVENVDIKNNPAHGYAAHIGFFKSFKCDLGRAIDEARGSDSYVPIRFININEVNKIASNTRKHHGEVIEEASAQLANFLVRDRRNDAIEMLTYSIREMMRNSIEHSKSKYILYCGQYYPTINRVEIAIIDEGIGIKNSLSKNSTLTINDDNTALSLAILPGISRVRQKKSYYEDDPWRNTGYGLYVTSKLCKECGNFLIASGNSSLLTSQDKIKSYDTSYNGTAISLSVFTDKISNFQKNLPSIVREGTKLAKNSKLPANLSASMVSKILTQGR